MSRTDRASLVIHVDQETVFAALTGREALLAWLPPQGMHGHFERFDLRDGGSYRLVLTYDDASGSPGKTAADSDVSEVRIARIVPGEVVEQDVDFESDDPAVQGTMRMAWRLRPSEDGTVVEFEARDVPEGISARDHAAGLTSSLANLAAYLEPGEPGEPAEPEQRQRDERQTYPEGYAAAHGSFALIPAAYVFLVDGDRVLLQMRAGTGYYDGWWAATAAGHVEFGETVFAGAARELLEEVGVEVDESDLEPITAMHRTAPTGLAVDQRLDVFFVARAWRGIPSLQEEKASALEWFPLSALPERLVHHERFALEGWRDGGLPAITAFGF